MSELGLELEERDGGIFVTEVQEHGCVAVHGRFSFYKIKCLCLGQRVDVAFTCTCILKAANKKITTKVEKIKM